MNDIAHDLEGWQLSELDHCYGRNVHILNDPYYATMLASLCSPETGQPMFNRLIRRLYEGLCRAVINNEFPRKARRVRTRMAATTERAVVGADFLAPETEVVVVDIVRAGILPAMTCYDLLNESLNPARIRQDHLVMERQTDDSGAVIGALMSGTKVGGPIEGRHVLFPDPMGATGSSLCQAIEYYTNALDGTPGPVITMNLIVTPQYVRAITSAFPNAKLYALRLDRGLSAPDVLATKPGERWNEETGLNAHDYIVPGGGGFGELINNALV